MVQEAARRRATRKVSITALVFKGRVRSVAANEMPGEEYLMGTAESLELQNAHFCSRVSFALEQDFFLLFLILQSLLVW